MPMATVNYPTRTPERPRRPKLDGGDQDIDLDRVVFDPEYRARVREVLNRSAREPRRDPDEAG